MLNGIGLSRRDMFRPLLAKSQVGSAMPSLPRGPAPGQPVAPKGWEVFSDVIERIRESLPKGSSGNQDVDFALLAAPILEALTEAAAERASASSDKRVRALARKITESYIVDLQTLIDWLQSNGHGEQ